MASDPDRVQNVFQRMLEIPLAERSVALDEACNRDDKLRQQVEAMLAAHSQQAREQPPTRESDPGSSIAATLDSERPSGMVDPSEEFTQNVSATQDSEPGPGATADFCHDSVSGAVIAGRYTLQAKIGEGGMGEVWVAKQTTPVQRKVALKLIKKGMDSKSVLQRFEQERQALAMMDHPNIARVLDGGITPSGQPFFVMELVKGKPLTQFCDEAKLTTGQRLELFVPICQAVQHAHQKGIVHRDLKPANILVTSIDSRPVAKVIDFGVAKATAGKLTDVSMSTQFGAVVGTLEYMSPEQAGYSCSDVDTRADIYSLGVVLYELLTGLRPIDASRLRKAGLAEMIRLIQEEEPSKPSTRLSTDAALPSLAAVRGADPRRLTSMLRGELDWVVMKCLEKTRERRYETANALSRDIQRFLVDEPVEARPASASYRIQKFLQRNRGSVLAASLVAISLIVGLAGTVWGLVQARRQEGLARQEATAAESARASEFQQRQIAEQANGLAFDALNAFTSELMSNVLGGKQELTTTETSILESAQQQWQVFADSKGDSVQSRVIRAAGAQNLGVIQLKLGLLEEAEASERQALAIRAALAQEFPKNVQYQESWASRLQQLGGLLRGSGQRAEAEQNFKQAEKIYATLSANNPSQGDLARSWSETCISVANVERDFGNWSESRSYYLKALGIQQKLTEKFPRQPNYWDSLARSNWGLAYLSKRLGEYDEASGYYLRAISVYEDLAGKAPEAILYRQALGSLRREYGVSLGDRGQDEAAAEQLRLALPYQQAIVSEFPSMPEYRLDLARTQRDYAKILGYLDQTSLAEAEFGSALEQFKLVTDQQPTNLLYQREFGMTYTLLANLHYDDNQLEKALAAYNLAAPILTQVYVQNQNVVLARNALCQMHEYRADTLDRLERHRDALVDRNKVLQFCGEEKRTIHRYQQVDTRLRAGEVEAAVAELEILSQLENDNQNHWFQFAKLYAIAGGELPERQAELQSKSLQLLNKAIGLGFDDLERLRSESDLDSLRELPGFKAVLAELESC